MPGNLPAQFQGGDGAVRFPTYPVTKKNLTPPYYMYNNRYMYLFRRLMK